MSGRRRYPRDLLARTAAVSTSLVDLMRRLDAPLGPEPRRYLRDRLRHYGISTSHFRKGPLPTRPRRTYPKELLEEAAAHSHSVREMFEYMGLPNRRENLRYLCPSCHSQTGTFAHRSSAQRRSGAQ